MSRAVRATFLGFVAAGIVALACSSPDKDGRVDPIGPDRAQFASVSRALVFHCGTLDCHGSPYKNMRLYGYGGLRLPDANVPDFGDYGQRQNEVEANYESVISLEPEIMRAVVAEKGAQPERLSLIRKARGIDGHKGRDPFPAGSPGDRCLTSWLASAVDSRVCEAIVPLPEPTDASTDSP